MKTDLSTTRKDRAAIVMALRAAGGVIGDRNAMRCPFHDDKHASAGIYLAPDGAWKFKCQTCGIQGDVFDIIAKSAGKPVADVIREQGTQTLPPPQRPATVAPTQSWGTLAELAASLRGVAAVYDYKGMAAIRLNMPDGGKQFRLCSPTSGGRWHMKKPEGPLPLYRRDLLTADRVAVVEGEKCVDALAALGIAATTSAMGAGKADQTDWSPLAGKTVILWPDNDPDNGKGVRVGIAHMREVARLLTQIDPAPRMLWLDPDTLGLPLKGDAADMIAINTSEDFGVDGLLDMIEDVLYNAKPMGASADLSQLMGDIRAGKLRTLKWPWPNLLHATKATMPGTVTVICGDPGASKSFWLLQAFIEWHQAGHKVALFELEESKTYHLRRVMAMAADNSKLFDNDWVENNPAESKRAEEDTAALIDSFGTRIFDNEDDSITLKALADWVEKQAIAGCDVIGIDPVTAAATGNKPWEDDREFMMRVKRVARQFDTRVFLVTHPKKGGASKDGSIQDGLAGGAAYSRFPQTILHLKRPDDAKEVSVLQAFDHNSTREFVRANRFFHIGKARNGRGAGMEVAMNFDGATLKIHDLGLVVKERR